MCLQENLDMKMTHAHLEGEIQRLRDELQRRETALHRSEAQGASQSRDLATALEELTALRSRLDSQDREDQKANEGDDTGNKSEIESHGFQNLVQEQVSCCHYYTPLLDV